MTAHLEILRERFPGQVALGVSEIAQCLNLSRDHIYRLSSQQRLPFPLLKGLGDKVQVSIVALAMYLDGDIVEPPEPQLKAPEMVIKRKPGRPRTAQVSKLQLAFQSELKLSILSFESEAIFAQLQEQITGLSYEDNDKTTCAQKFEEAKAGSLTFAQRAHIDISRKFMNLQLPPAPRATKKHGRL